MKKFICMTLTAATALSIFSFGGCAKKENASQSEESAAEFAFADFEQWGPDFQLMRLVQNFGVVKRNSDPAFVKSGKYSAKLNPMGGYIRYSEPILYFPTVSTLFDFAYNDFTQFEEINAQLYNDTEKDVEVVFGMVTAINSPREITVADGETYTLKSKSWTRIDYWINHSFLSLSLNINDVKGIYFKFANAGVEKAEEAPTIYLDDIKFRRASEKVQPENLVNLDKTGKDAVEMINLPVLDEAGEPVLDEKGKAKYEWVKKEVTKYEILDFEEDWQKYALSAKRTALPENTFEYELARSEEGGIQASSGSRMLKITRHSGTTTSSYLNIPEIVMKSSALSSIPEEEWATTYLSFDIYADFNSGSMWQYMLVAPYFYYEGGKGWMSPVRASTGKTWAHGLDLKYGEWVTYQVPLSELAKDDKKYVTAPGMMQIQMVQITDGNDYVMYLDNIHISRIKK